MVECISRKLPKPLLTGISQYLLDVFLGGKGIKVGRLGVFYFSFKEIKVATWTQKREVETEGQRLYTFLMAC